MDHTFREEDRVVIAEFHGVGPFRGTVIQADDEQVEVLVDEGKKATFGAKNSDAGHFFQR